MKPSLSLNLVTDEEKVTKLNDTLNDIIDFVILFIHKLNNVKKEKML